MADSLLSDLLNSKLRPDTNVPLQRQISDIIRAAVEDGTLRASARLPASRVLASALGVARITVVNAYAKLSDDGYLHTGSTSGTFVSDILPGKDRVFQSSAPRRPLSRRGTRIVDAPAGVQEFKGAFVQGVCDVDYFPVKVWRSIQNRYLGASHADLMGYSGPGGYLPLRRALAEYLRVSRAVRASPEQIIVTMGVNQSLDLCSRLLADEGQVAYVEDPCHWAAPIMLRANGLDVKTVAVDCEGMRVDQCTGQPRLVVTTPSHQFPMGVALSSERRKLLLARAEEWDAFILEDDYDSEFRYGHLPLPSLQGVDTNNRVILMGTFSKVMYPGMRLSYIVVPPDLVDGFSAGSLRLYRPGHLSLQAALTDFIVDGHFSKHIRQMREVYGERQCELLHCLSQDFGNDLETSRHAAGLHLTVRIKGLADFDTAVANSRSAGISLRRLSAYNQEISNFRDGFLLGYGAIESDIIKASTDIFSRVIQPLIHR